MSDPKRYWREYLKKVVAIKYYKNILPKRPKSDFLNVAAATDATQTPGYPKRLWKKIRRLSATTRNTR